MIDLNQAEILANRLREKHDFWQGGIDWDRIFREQRDMEDMFPELVSELKQARSELKETRTKLRQARGRTKYLTVIVDMVRAGDW